MQWYNSWCLCESARMPGICSSFPLMLSQEPRISTESRYHVEIVANGLSILQRMKHWTYTGPFSRYHLSRWLLALHSRSQDLSDLASYGLTKWYGTWSAEVRAIKLDLSRIGLAPHLRHHLQIFNCVNTFDVAKVKLVFAFCSSETHTRAQRE